VKILSTSNKKLHE
jgi:hypothetical protein